MSGHVRTTLSKIKLHSRCGSYLGRLTPTFVLSNGFISHISLSEKTAPEIISEEKQPHLIEQIELWLAEYCEGKPPSITLPLSPLTKGQKALASIPFGSVVSYKELATMMGSPKGARAAGTICNKNPYPLVIPCHRVIKTDGSLGGFAYPLALKELLITFERTNLNIS